ncbi:MAG: YczE/YyaS/YitT family protein [Ilumatobacteraceae bacterium]
MAIADPLLPTRPYHPRSVAADWGIRLGRCVAGLFLFGFGIALIIEADLGLAPWDVFHQGVAKKLDVPVGTVIIATGLLLLLLWIPLRQKPGVGTILNAVEIGVTVDLLMPLIPTTSHLAVRVTYLVIGLVIIAIGSGLYIGAGLGPGPRDGLMMGFAQRGVSVRLARTLIEITVLVVGLFLGGSVGIGTVAFTFGIGPLVQVFLPLFALPPRSISSGSGRS